MFGEIMTSREYREHEGISRSELNVIRTKTPMHFLYAKDHPEEDKISLLEGRAAHKLILEPDSFLKEFAIAPACDRRTKEGKESWSMFMETAKDKDVLSADSYQKVKDMAEAIKKNEEAMKYLKGTHERSFFWTDPDTGEACKVRPDCITEVDGIKYIVDYKTTDSCADGHFERSVKKYGYKFQSGMYREGVFQNTFEDYGFAFVAQEKSAPYASRVYICSDEFIREGFEQFKEALNTYHFCKEQDEWPGYPSDYLYGEEEGK